MTEQTNSSANVIGFDLSAPWKVGKLTLAKRLNVAGKTSKATSKAGDVEYFYPCPWVAPLNKAGEYENAAIAFAHSALVSAVQVIAKAAYDVLGDTPDTLKVVAVDGKEVPKTWADLESQGRTRYFEELKLLGQWRVGFAEYLSLIGKIVKQVDNACEAFTLASAEKMSQNRWLADDAKRAVIAKLVDQYHAALEPEALELLAPAIRIVSRAFELASTLVQDEADEL
jgi:hypothetical protein